MPRKDDNPYTLHMIRLFLRAETRIINELGRLRAKGLIDYHAEAALGRVQEILKSLKADGWEYVPKMVETEFYVHHPEQRKIPWTGLSEPVEKHIKGYENAKLTGTQTRVAEILTRQLMLDIDEACDTAEKNLENIILGRRKDDAVRHIGLKYALEQEATGLKLPELTQNFLGELAIEGVSCFTDKAGREWRLSTYGAMVLRTVTAQAQVMAVLTQDPGRDLYQISEIGTTCPICAPLEGRVYSRSGQDPDFPPLAWAFGKIDPDGPDTLENTWLNIHPNCLVPGGSVLAEGVVAHSSRDYDGPVIRLVTSSGHEITVTPNHPILTTEGFVPAGTLHEGQKIIEATGEYGAFIGKAPNNVDVPTPVEEVAESLVHSCRCSSSRVKCSPEQFHGDGSADGEVNIVHADSFCRSVADSTRIEEILEAKLPPTHFGRVLLNADCAVFKIRFGALHAANSVMRRLGLVLGRKLVSKSGEQFSNQRLGTRTLSGDFLISRPTVVQREHFFKKLSVGFKVFRGNVCKRFLGCVVNGKPVVKKGACYDVRPHSEMLRNLYATEPLCAEGLERGFCNHVFVVSDLLHVEHTSYCGKVYNLQTKHGFYVYNSIVTHNCLHSIMPFTTAGKTEAEIERLKRFSSFTLNPPTHDPRSEAQIQAYRDKQRARAKHNRDLEQFEKYRAAIPDICPKSFSTFMKHKTLRDDKYKAWVSAYKASA